MAKVRERVEFNPRRSAPVPGATGSGGQIARGTIPPGVTAARETKGRLAFSSMMSGHVDDEKGHRLPDTVDEEAVALFDHIRQFMEAAGGSPKDLLHITLYVMDDAYRPIAENQVIKMFPDETRRPTYHVVNVAPAGLRHERVQAVIAASLH